jgi:hypothetical protein
VGNVNLNPDIPAIESPEISTDRFRKKKESERASRDRWLRRYTDLEQLLFRGFLCVFVDLCGVRFVFKSINTTEMDRVKFYLGSKNVDPFSYQLYFIAYSIFMVEDTNILPCREQIFPQLVANLRTISKSLLSRIATILSDLNSKSVLAGSLTEAYNYEDVSRQNWASYRDCKITDPNVTGCDGTQYLGFNAYQKLWVALNRFDDFRTQREIDWDNAKFIGSCFNPKGVQKIEHQDSARRDTEKKEREAIRLGGVREENGDIKISAESVEELMDQLERSVKGEKDYHDSVVDSYEQKIKDDFAKRRKEYIDTMQQTHEDRFATSSVEEARTFLSLDAVNKSMEDRRAIAREARTNHTNVDAEQERVLRYVNPSISSTIVDAYETETPDISKG